MKTMRQILLDCKDEEYQLLHECCMGARQVKRRKDIPAHVALTIATQRYSVKQLLHPRYGTHIGVIVWIPLEEFDRLTRKEGNA